MSPGMAEEPKTVEVETTVGIAGAGSGPQTTAAISHPDESPTSGSAGPTFQVRPAKKTFPPKTSPEVESQIVELGRKGLSAWQIMRALGLRSTSAADRILRERGLTRAKSATGTSKAEAVEPRTGESEAPAVELQRPVYQFCGPTDCPDCCHEPVCLFKARAAENRDWALCKFWMGRPKAKEKVS